MADLGDVLDSWLSDVKDATTLTIAEKTQITSAGAKAYAKRLSEVTRSQHYRNHKTGDELHLANSVVMQKTDIDGTKSGVSTVGFDDDHAYVARFLNDGTKFISGDHFVDDLLSTAKADVFEAEQNEYQKIIRKKGD